MVIQAQGARANGVQATAGPVKKKALSYVKAWAKQFEDTGDPNLGIMGELYDQLRAKSE
jgi:signal transducing adaptor molecule